jgi:hypothetical protein
MTGTVFLGASEYSVLEGESYVSVTFQWAGARFLETADCG